MSAQSCVGPSAPISLPILSFTDCSVPLLCSIAEHQLEVCHLSMWVLPYSSHYRTTFASSSILYPPDFGPSLRLDFSYESPLGLPCCCYMTNDQGGFHLCSGGSFGSMLTDTPFYGSRPSYLLVLVFQPHFTSYI